MSSVLVRICSHIAGRSACQVRWSKGGACQVGPLTPYLPIYKPQLLRHFQFAIEELLPASAAIAAKWRKEEGQGGGHQTYWNLKAKQG